MNTLGLTHLEGISILSSYFGEFTFYLLACSITYGAIMYMLEHQSIIPSLIFSMCFIMVDQEPIQEILGPRQGKSIPSIWGHQLMEIFQQITLRMG